MVASGFTNGKRYAVELHWGESLTLGPTGDPDLWYYSMESSRSSHGETFSSLDYGSEGAI